MIIILVLIMVIIILLLNSHQNFGNVYYSSPLNITINISTKNSVPSTLTFTTPSKYPTGVTSFYKFPLLYLFDVSNVPGLNNTNINTLFNTYSGTYSKSFLKPARDVLLTRAITTTGNYTIIAPGVTTLPSGPGPSWTGYPPNILDISKIDTVLFKNQSTNPATNVSNGIPINTTVTIDISEVIASYVSVMKSENLYVLGLALQNQSTISGTNPPLRDYYSFYYIIVL